MKHTITIFLLSLALSTYGQDYQLDFQKLCQDDKRKEILPLLIQWEKDRPNDPEMFIAYFNYYLQESKQELIQLGNEPGQGDNLILSDTATHEPVGYMYSTIHYNDTLFQRAQDYLIKGIAKNPKRLDMYFGRIYSLREKGLYEEHVNEVLKVIDLHKTYKSGWLWSNNEKLEAPEQMFKGSIQDYNYALFNLEVPYTDGIEKISNKMIELYPNGIENYSNLGACSLINGDLHKALELFQKAHEIDPNDVLVLSNIAYTYIQLDKKDKAIEYYKKIIEKGKPQEIEFAEYQIEQLGKK